MLENRKKRTITTPELRAEIAAELKRDPNCNRVAKKFGISYMTGKKIADDNDIILKGHQLRGIVYETARYSEIAAALEVNPGHAATADKTGASPGIIRKVRILENIKPASVGPVAGQGNTREMYELLIAICGKMPWSQLDKHLELKVGTIRYFIACPELHTERWIKETLTPKLLSAFPNKVQEIKAFEAAAIPSTMSVNKIKKHVKAEQEDFRVAAGMLLRELRETCEQTFEDVQQSVKTPILKKNLGRIEAGDKSLALSIYRAAIPEVFAICKKHSPERAGHYLPVLEKVGARLKR